MNRVAALLIAALSLSAVPVVAHAADDTRAEEAAASPELKKDLKKLMEAYGNGSMSAKEYKERKEALLAGKK